MFDPICMDCPERGGKPMFDLKRLGAMVLEYKIPDKPLFKMNQEEITKLGECFLESMLEKDFDSTEKVSEADLPF